MKRFDECPSDVICDGRRSWRGSLQEEKGGIALDVTADRPFALHLLDSNALFGANDLRCDGALVSEAEQQGLVCFLELKGAIDPEDPDHPFDQIRASIQHFAPMPQGSDHGEEHHALWRAGDDLPNAPRGRGRARALAIGPSHAVAGAVIVSRGGSRHPPRTITIAGKQVFIAVIPAHGNQGRVALTLDELEDAVSTA